MLNFNALLDSKRMGKIKAHGIQKKKQSTSSQVMGFPCATHGIWLDSIGMNTQPKNGQTMSPFSIPKMPGKRTRRNLFFHFKLVEVRDIPARNDVFESLLCCCCSRHSRRCFSSSEFVQRRLLPKCKSRRLSYGFILIRVCRISWAIHQP